MKWAHGICTGMLLLVTPSIVFAVDCDNAYTKVERAICTSPRLLEAERQLAALADEALDTGHIDPAQSKRLRDSMALGCRRSSQMSQCLLSVAEQKIQWLALVTGNATASDDSDARTVVGTDL